MTKQEVSPVVPYTVVPFPPRSLVYQMASPAYTVTPPDIVHRDRIPESIQTAIKPIWTANQAVRPIGFHSLRHVYIAGEGLVFDANFNVFEPCITQNSPRVIEHHRTLLRLAHAKGEVATYPGPILMCGKAGMNNYGHWLAEMLPRAYLSKHWIDQPNGWRVVVPKIYPWMAGVIADSFALLEMPRERILFGDDRPWQVTELVVMTGLSDHGRYFSPLVVEAMDALAERVPAQRHERIWVSRAGEPRSLVDEAGAQDRLARSGWTVIEPYSLSLRDQIGLAKGCRHMAGVNGAGLANLLFMRPGGMVTSVMPANMPDIFYWQFCGHRGLRYRELRSGQAFGEMPTTSWNTPLTMGVDEILSDLEHGAAA